MVGVSYKQTYYCVLMFQFIRVLTHTLLIFCYTHIFHLAFYFSRVHESLFFIVASYENFFFFNSFSSVFLCACVFCSVTVLLKWVAPPKMVYSWYRF